jgi:outer membrane protein
VQTYVPPSTIQPGWQVQLGTVFPIFNGFSREDQIERAKAAREVARITARDAARNARAQAEALLGSVRLAAEQIRLARVSLASAQENYRVEQSRYGVGVATVLDLAVAEENLALAEEQLVNARYDYQLARANLDTLVGRDL